MPVIPYKKTVDIDTYGVFAGFGAAPVAPTDQFTGWPSLEAKRAGQAEVKKAILAADKAIYGAYDKMPGIFSTLIGFSLPMGGVVAVLSSSVRDQIQQSANDQAAQWELAKKTLWEVANFGTITVDGQARSVTPDEMAKLVGIISKQIVNMQGALELANDTTVTALLKSAAADLISGIITVLNKAKDTVLEAINAILDIAKGGLGAAGFLGRNWPWLLLGGIGIFYVLPTLTKTARAYRGGGFDAGSAALEEDIRAAREKAAAGARSAASGAVSVGKKAAALYTGNPALLMAGMKRRRTRRRR
jgi:hypothetical protein